MEMHDSQRIRASRQAVYDALNNPEVLKQCIPGCEELEMISETEMKATVLLRVGPVKARFKGTVELSDLNPPEGYTISGEGKGGVAGFAKGGATVQLSEDGEDTILQYDVKADIGGKLAQLGSRLIDSTSKKLAGQFFTNFAAIFEENAPA
ncbi:SRPBCC family protein [Hoeflea prorocentri]|uniref:Carbon monoxide dehydrogenase subunit G n=1 Tax=Hoeflea prorocentri TaxID=1922333 RepID=A0A9X3UEP8_9HYPH|nr:carbon monoxide dehydrogenase subunit G [Hoeflea prorocentri]MCY6379159.1 carbon monoxide dehydrogenase subunit G [Hoeflea prorocentri]MDA5396960.1 carbon monoxide dehydrogenase subunit G [Hoeflea prorocentri]